MPTDQERFEDELRMRAADFKVELNADVLVRLGRYNRLLLKWNDRLHLVAPCSPEEFATRHVLESLLVLRHVGAGMHLLDVGSGAGLPAIPCLIADENLQGTLIESSKKKAVFLKEVLHSLELADRCQVLPERFEETTLVSADIVTCRAIDRFESILPELIAWTPPKSTLIFFAGETLCNEIIKLLPGAEKERIPLSERRFLIKTISPGSAGALARI
jgi:16S rRNA (guanine527-N7)-methyltransferase